MGNGFSCEGEDEILRLILKPHPRPITNDQLPTLNMIVFPQDFLWGSATSSYQVEGDNSNSDWWHWEKETGKINSGAACRHYELYARDFDLAKQLNQNAHRLSIEWSRIEPREGEFSSSELEHYIDVTSALRERGLEPIVTLHHFSNPQWFAQAGAWQKASNVRYFLRFARYVVEALADKVRYWIIINEPLVYAYHAYILGVWPPQETSLFKAMQVENNFSIAHIKAYRLIKDIYQRKNAGRSYVGIAKNTQAFVPCRRTAKDKISAYLRDQWYNFRPVERLIRHKSLDFIGINYYSRQLVEVEKWGLRHCIMDTCRHGHHPVKKNSLGWDIYPQGLYELLVRFKKYNLPLMITENGICSEDDALRWEYIFEHLRAVHQAMQAGARVFGYLYWSLIDNFEWDKGFKPRFGIIEVDYNTYQRRVRQSARRFAAVCREGVLE